MAPHSSSFPIVMVIGVLVVLFFLVLFLAAAGFIAWKFFQKRKAQANALPTPPPVDPSVPH